jgi:chorismate mutase
VLDDADRKLNIDLARRLDHGQEMGLYKQDGADASADCRSRISRIKPRRRRREFTYAPTRISG